MYKVFDDFCRRPTWDTSHPSDRQIFRAALRSAIRLPGFSPEGMAAYIRANHAKPIWPKSDAEIAKAIGSLVKEAKAALAHQGCIE